MCVVLQISIIFLFKILLLFSFLFFFASLLCFRICVLLLTDPLAFRFVFQLYTPPVDTQPLSLAEELAKASDAMAFASFYSNDELVDLLAHQCVRTSTVLESGLLAACEAPDVDDLIEMFSDSLGPTDATQLEADLGLLCHEDIVSNELLRQLFVNNIADSRLGIENLGAETIYTPVDSTLAPNSSYSYASPLSPMSTWIPDEDDNSPPPLFSNSPVAQNRRGQPPSSPPQSGAVYFRPAKVGRVGGM
jgi:hypothetical protein